jgi:hypothetical protein
MRIEADLGMCEAMAPGFFEVGDEGTVVVPDERPGEDHRHDLAAAVDARHALDPASARALGPVPYFWSDWYGHRIQFVGTQHADEAVVQGDTTLYRRGDRVVGALTVDRPREIMKYRRRIAARAAWSEAPAFAGAA